MASKFVQSGSLASKSVTTVETVPMEFDEADIMFSALPRKADPDKINMDYISYIPPSDYYIIDDESEEQMED
ncbi:hypothetical protein INT47_002952, partial [Mucor saturninus]